MPPEQLIARRIPVQTRLCVPLHPQPAYMQVETSFTPFIVMPMREISGDGAVLSKLSAVPMIPNPSISLMNYLSRVLT